MNILQSTFDRHKILMLEHIEALYEGSLTQNPKFQEDVKVLEKAYKELFLASDTAEVVNSAKELSPDMFEIYGTHSVKRTVKINLDYKFTIEILIKDKPKNQDSVGVYDPEKDAIAFIFYKIAEKLPQSFIVNQDFDIKKFYNENLEWINSTIAHELSHAYKQRFRSRKHSKAFVNPGDVASGKKNYADYAKYDDERESYLAEIWREMQKEKAEYPDSSFYGVLRNSATFQKTIQAMGGEGTVNKKYKKLYNYFLKKLVELWKNAGHKIDKEDINKAVELC